MEMLLLRVLRSRFDHFFVSVRILLSPGAMNLEELIIVPKQFCWKLFIDVEIYEDSGNVIDVSLLSILVALRTTRLPITTPLKNSIKRKRILILMMIQHTSDASLV